MAYTERYVSVAGGGAHDGTSEANAWTITEAFTNAVAGERVNIISGSYTVAAAEATAVGTFASFLTFRGYNSSIGDLDNQGRNSDTTLNTTNFPELTLTSNLVVSSYVQFMNLVMTGTHSGDMIGDGNNDRMWFVNCYMENDSTNAASVVVRCDDGLFLINCDLYTGTGNFLYIVRNDYHGVFKSCRFIALGTTTSYMFRINNPCFLGCFVSGNGNDVINANNTLYVIVLDGNTFYDCGEVFRYPNSAPQVLPALLNNHVTDSAQWIDNLYSSTSNIAMLEVNNRTRDITTLRTGVGDGTINGEVTTDTGGPETDYVDAPNGDITLIATAPAVDAGLGM